MLHDLMEYFVDRTAKRHGWTWQRYVITPFVASAIVIGLIYLAISTAHWWIPALFGLIS